MDMNLILERKFYNDTVGLKETDNTWKLIVTLGEKIVLKDGTVREEKLEAMSLDTDFGSAQRIALRSVLQQMDDLVYARGFDSLIDAVDYQKSLEKPNGGNTNNAVTAP